MRFLNIFKSSNNQNKRGDGNNKENNDPRAANPNSADENGQRRQTRRVNFQQGGKGGGGGRRRSCMTDLEEEDGGSEVTLTATEAGRPQQQLAPPNPYSIITEPKRNLGPRSCPGGHHQYFGDFLENDSSESAANGHHPILDRSFDAHSEFTNNQHRRSSRRRIIGGTVIGLGGGQDPNVQKFERQIPFGEIGNGPGLRRNRHWIEQREEGESSSARAASSSFARYKNLPLVDAGQAKMNARMRQMQKELMEWEFAYREERARRKAMQRDLRREQQLKEKLATENGRLRTIIINLFLRQQPNSNGPPNLVGIDPNLLFGGLCPSSSWANHTPSTSSAVDPLPPWTTPNFPNPPYVGLFPFGQKGGTAIPSSNGPGECLAQPLFSSSSLMNGPIVDGVARSSNSLEKDEIKIFRNGTDSFSGGSSRPTTGDKIEGELISEQSSRERGSFSSPEIGRSEGGKQNGGNGTFCLSFSADDCRQRELLANSMQLGEDIGQPNREDDAGYATSETTNISASMCTAMGGYEGKSAEFGKEMKTHFPALRSSMSAETI